MKRKEVEKSVDRHIRIVDLELLEQIDKIMEYPGFKSFSKVINEALYIALPKILERLEGKEEITLPDTEGVPPSAQLVTLIDGELYGELVRLLKEINLNGVINKSILSSVFHGLADINKVLDINNRHYKSGLLSDTPEYLERFETQQLKKLSQ